MTTHLRARTTQAGAFLALVAGLVVGVQTAALADPPDVQIQSLAPNEVTTGSTVTMQYTVSNPGSGEGGEEGEQPKPPGRVSIRVTGMGCSGDCGAIRQIDGSASFTANLTAPDVPAGETKSVTVQVTATANGETGTASETVTVTGPAKPTSVQKVTGKVKDGDGKKIAGVAVAMQDAAGNDYSTTTSGSGSYSFASSDSQPIEAGTITVGALKEGYSSTTVTVQGKAGRSVNVPITLKKLVAESPSASPEPSVSVSAKPTDDEVTDEPTDEATDDPTPTLATTPAADSSESGTNWLLIIMGVLLVAAGIGAMALVILRRKNSGGDDLDGPGAGGGFGPPDPGGFDATRVAAPMGAGRGGDATMIAPAGGLGGGISDAPTMIHRPVVEDEFPDPYGAPVPPQGGYAGTSQWGDDADQGGYGGTGGGYGQQQQGGYGQPGGYGATQAGGDSRRLPSSATTSTPACTSRSRTRPTAAATPPASSTSRTMPATTVVTPTRAGTVSSPVAVTAGTTSSKAATASRTATAVTPSKAVTTSSRAATATRSSPVGTVSSPAPTATSSRRPSARTATATATGPISKPQRPPRRPPEASGGLLHVRPRRDRGKGRPVRDRTGRPRRLSTIRRSGRSAPA